MRRQRRRTPRGGWPLPVISTQLCFFQNLSSDSRLNWVDFSISRMKSAVHFFTEKPGSSTIDGFSLNLTFGSARTGICSSGSCFFFAASTTTSARPIRRSSTLSFAMPLLLLGRPARRSFGGGGLHGLRLFLRHLGDRRRR